MSVGRCYRNVIRMLWYAYLSVRIAQDLDVAVKQSQQHEMEMFAKEEVNQPKSAGKMKSLNCSRTHCRYGLNAEKGILKMDQV